MKFLTIIVFGAMLALLVTAAWAGTPKTHHACKACARVQQAKTDHQHKLIALKSGKMNQLDQKYQAWKKANRMNSPGRHQVRAKSAYTEKANYLGAHTSKCPAMGEKCPHTQCPPQSTK